MVAAISAKLTRGDRKEPSGRAPPFVIGARKRKYATFPSANHEERTHENSPAFYGFPRHPHSHASELALSADGTDTDAHAGRARQPPEAGTVRGNDARLNTSI